MADAVIYKRFTCKVLCDEILNIFLIEDLKNKNYYYYVFNEGDEEQFKMIYNEDNLPDVFHRIIDLCIKYSFIVIHENSFIEFGPYLMRNNKIVEIHKIDDPFITIQYDNTCKWNKHDEKDENYINWIQNIMNITSS